MEAILNGLLADHGTFVVSVNSKSEAYTVEEIKSLLLAQKARMERHTKELDSSSHPIDIATRGYGSRRQNRGRSSSAYSSNHQQNKNNVQANRGRHQSFNRNSGNRFSNLNRDGRQNWNSNNHGRCQCQVWGKSGHIAFDCWHRFDQDYQPSNSSSQSCMVAWWQHLVQLLTQIGIQIQVPQTI